ncbi:DEAD/DEAH box helicase [Haloarchaeobius sp. DFWS5]|uniref:DEAD/DEAH box helicase n=1 Tax=Haloarchaeobius sp. DFWS5 TaxID=3446114 RepID=UPI003EBEFCA9
MTQALKHESRLQNRRDPSPYTGDSDFIEQILQIFDFDTPLEFQTQSWELIEEFDRRRREKDTPYGGVFAAPTGFGKTEAFLGALYQLLAADVQESAALVYPRTALLQDQLGRILKHIHQMDTDLSVGIYIGSRNQPFHIESVSPPSQVFDSNGRFKLTNCWCGEEEEHGFYFEGGSNEYQVVCENNRDHQFSHNELILSKKEIAHNGQQPDILLTTLESLELFGLKPNYDIIDKIDTVVFDEIHMYTGLRGAHAARIIENINAVTDQPLLWLGASATIDNPERFAKKLFDLPPNRIRAIEPPKSDFDEEHNDREHFYFLTTFDEGPTVSALMLQQTMLLGHSVLGGDADDRSKALSFIDSKSQVNQKFDQLQDAERTKELWQLHREGDGYENWERVARELHEDHADPFWEENLEFLPVSADHGFNAEASAAADIMLTTSFLEVGIDVGTIEVVTQYRTPRELSSFIQRSGRAARKKGMDSHILVFLSTLTSDANMFYRADRFLDSELRTPLRPENKVVKWVHRSLQEFYKSVRKLRRHKRRYNTQRDQEQAFFKQYLGEALGFESMVEFLLDPSAAVGDRFDAEFPSTSLQAYDPIEDCDDALDAALSSLREEFKEVENFISYEGESPGLGSTGVQAYIGEVQDAILSFIEKCESEVEASAEQHSSHPMEGELLEQLDDKRKEVLSQPAENLEARIETFSSIIADFGSIIGQIKRLDGSTIGYGDLGEIENVVQQLEPLINDDRFEENQARRREIRHLKQFLEELRAFYDFDEKQQRNTNRPYESVHYVKSLLRSAYYFDRYKQVEDDGIGAEVWYVPPNYFNSSGQYVSVTAPGQPSREESIDSIVHSYAPLRSEYKQSGQIHLFHPRTRVEDGDVVFDFSDVPGDEEEGIKIPSEIPLSAFQDQSDDAKDVVQYCPVCYQILERGNCSSHGDSAHGKIHSDPQVSTDVETVDSDGEYERLSLGTLDGTVTLEGVSLDITPARYTEDGILFTGEEKIRTEISSPTTPLGFSLTTRGLTIDISEFIQEITQNDSLRGRVSRYKNLGRTSVEELGYHTAAHFFLQLVADISGVDTTMLFYGVDEGAGEVYVFERTEGGQGLTDLVFDELEIDPGNVLESMTRIGYNTQVINERLWADRSFATDVASTDRSEQAVQEVVDEHLSPEVPYDDIRERVAQEVVLTADRAYRLAQEEGVEFEDTCEVKHTIADAQIDGETDFPAEAVGDLEPGIENIDRARTRFFSPDIDGCVENLHISECISGHNQEDALSYVLLEVLRDHFLTRVPATEAGEMMFDNEIISAAEVNDESIFLRF